MHRMSCGQYGAVAAAVDRLSCNRRHVSRMPRRASGLGRASRHDDACGTGRHRPEVGTAGCGQRDESPTTGLAPAARRIAHAKRGASTGHHQGGCPRLRILSRHQGPASIVVRTGLRVLSCHRRVDDPGVQAPVGELGQLCAMSSGAAESLDDAFRHGIQERCTPARGARRPVLSVSPDHVVERHSGSRLVQAPLMLRAPVHVQRPCERDRPGSRNHGNMRSTRGCGSATTLLYSS